MNQPGAPHFDLASAPIGLSSISEEFRTNTHRFAQFARAVDDTNALHLAGSVGSPVFAHVPVMESMIDVVRGIAGHFIMHGEHDFIFHAPMLPGQRWFSTSELISARSTRAGVAFVIRSDTRTHDGQGIATQFSTCLARGLHASGEVGKGGPERPTPAEGKSVATCYPLAPDQTRRYADAARDYSPYTIDPEAAARLGFEAPLVHGMLTLALAARAIVDGPARGDTRRLRRLGCRFASPLLLLADQHVTVTVTEGGNVVGFAATDAGGHKVIQKGYAEVDG